MMRSGNQQKFAIFVGEPNVRSKRYRGQPGNGIALTPPGKDVVFCREVA
jgi:hypothetical protein